MATDIDKHIEKLRGTVMAAELNYDIWWVYKSKDTRPQYIETMNRYLLFFHTSIEAHFVATLLALYRLYDKRKRNNTFNIPSLLKKMENGNSIDKASLIEANGLCDKAKPLWKKVRTIRNEAIAHMTNKRTYEEVFKKADVTYDELRDLIEITKELLNKISHAWNGNTYAFNLESRDDTIRLLKDLKELAKMRSNS